MIIIGLKSCPVLNSVPPAKNVLYGRVQAEADLQNFPSFPIFLPWSVKQRSHRLFMVLNVSCRWKMEGSFQAKFRLRVAFCCTLEDPSNSIGSLNWYPGADIEEGAVMTRQRFPILVEEHLDHHLCKGRSCSIFTDSLKLHALLAKQLLVTQTSRIPLVLCPYVSIAHACLKQSDLTT